MRRRMYLAGAAVAVVSLVVGVGVALAADKSHANKPKVKVERVTCTMSLATTPPGGQAYVDQPPTQGDTYGPVHCPLLGSGDMHTAFNVPDSGDTVGTYVQYFQGGEVSGKFDMTPNESPPISPTGFYSQTWTGTITLDHGTGLYKGYQSKHGTGVINCSTADSGVHMSCTTRMRVKIPPPTSSGTAGPSGQ